jgi:hypothetical protein
MMECKKALVETNGDLDAAAELMRKAGLAKADKKAARIAAEGVLAIERSGDGRRAAIVEVNSSLPASRRLRWRSARRISKRCSRRRSKAASRSKRRAAC